VATKETPLRASAWLKPSVEIRDVNAEGHVERIGRSIVDVYRRKTTASAAHYSRAAMALAGGTTGNLRHFQPYPLYFSSGAASTVLDVDNNSYIDCFLCNGPLLLGHRHPNVVNGVRGHESVGSLVVNPPLAVELAEIIQATMPSAERIRFLNSGTEAVLTAVRLARAFSGKPKIVKFLGHYHGQDDQFLVGLDPSGQVFGSGIPPEAVANTLVLPYGDIDALVKCLDDNADVGAVILDPAMHSGGLWGSSTNYLKAVRDLTARRKVVLIFDEVITGFRLALGGAQSIHGVTPDLTTLAKALGAGEKLAAVVGREDIMSGVDPGRLAGKPLVFQSGTGNDGTIALAAARAAVTTYRELDGAGTYSILYSRAEKLAKGIQQAFRVHSVPCHVNQLGPMLQLFLSDAEPGFETFSRLPGGPLQLFYLALINEGILLSLPTSNHIYLSFAHSEGDIDRIIGAVSVVLDTYDFGALVRSAGHGAPN
jgi:glutamate-1-semialdehyde 2,1-aminomutase